MRLFAILGLTLSAICSAQPGGGAILEDIRIQRHIAVPMRDGVKLYGDLYRPRREAKFPVLLVRTPYGVQRDGVHQNMMEFAQQGYAVFVQDVRGRYESEGQWEPFRSEGPDGYDTIEWLAKQPWSNGKVGLQGGSYLGHVQWRAATQTPPSLVTMFPAVASTSIYRNWLGQGGAFRLSFNYGWGVVRMPNRIMLPQFWHTEKFSPTDLKYESILWHLPLSDIDLQSAGTAVPHFRDWVKHQSYDEYWRSISDEELFEKVKVPAHTSGGWFDIFLNGTINGFTGVRRLGGTEKARRESKMIIGAWGHGPSQKFGDVDFGPTANRNLIAHQLRWYDHYLKGVENGIDKEPPVQLFFMGVNQWRTAEEWPLPGTKYTPFYLISGGSANSARGNGAISVSKPAQAGKDEYAYDPNQPVPTLGGNNCCGTPTLAGPKDQRPIESRHDVLVYTGAILTEPVTIAGPVKMKLWAATDGRDTDWMVKLVDVAPNGFAMNIAEGILRARFRNGLDKMALLEPGKAYEFEVDMAGTANVFQKGHRIRVDITSSNFPQFDRNPNTGEDLGASSRVRTAKQTIHHGGVQASYILLPVI
ncbi:MAG TPA: CocE/NonD family hydrolase [Bryobacteraceae bacterium]|nr:CocE/NonD family hydrolase [Bryobacteraceae bacterium]